jgi:DNA mismatch repair protein MutL
MAIRQLPADVAAKIAAGEVVERPASVVKELVENAIDAGARHIRVDLSGGGLRLIRVTDDGRGIAASELPLAFARHATSKIGTLDDLEHIRTLGFRGEALASIAAVARVTLVSRTHEDARDGAAGAQVTVENGALGPVAPAGAPAGTSITVRDLFAEVPARLKFLKTRATETGHCLHLLEQYALAYPEIRFVAASEERQVFASPGDGKLLSALVAVYGLRVAEEMVPCGEEADAGGGNERAEHPLAGGDRPRVHGYTSLPTCYKATRQYLSFFVNRRWVQSRTLGYAVAEAYHSLLLAGRHPVAVINVEIDPALVDVNVHPAKTEVKFLRERQVYAVVQRAVRAALVASATTPEVAPGAFVIPTWGEPHTGAMEEGDAESAGAAEAARRQAQLWAGLAQLGRRDMGAGERADEGAGHAARGAAGGFVVPGTDAEGPVGGGRLPVLRVLGQVSQAYIVTEGPDGVYLIDQHAAHERILLERMVAEWRARAVSSQMLLEPQPLELAPAEREAVEEHLEALARLGFALEPFGEDALLVRAVPGALAAQARPQALRELLVELAGGDDAAARHGETWEEHALANVACKAAIKAGQTLAPEEQRELIRQLEGTEARQSCCHGRPTMVHLSLDVLERQFDRR